MSCPANSFVFNSTNCQCNPGFFLDSSGKRCDLYGVSDAEWSVSSGVDYKPVFFETLFSFDSIKKFTQSQAVFLEATLVALLSWLLFCGLIRLGRLDGGNSVWFRIRWWISRLDFYFSTRHYLEDQKFVKKRKTELGGTFSVASFILFIGLFAALLYQILTRRTFEVHNVKPTNAPDLLSFRNDMEFNITTVSSMTCSHLRSLGTLVIGSPGSIEHRVSPLANFVNNSCQNSSMGPTITLKCINCQVPRDSFYISWQFIDLPNNPATAVGFEFNLTTKRNGDNEHVSSLRGKVNFGSTVDDRPHTFRGLGVNILKFHLFPRLYRNLKDLRLIQPLFHEFVPGSSFFEASKLQASLQNPKDGLVNVTLHGTFISDYIIEINNENILGPVSFLADLGGLYAVSIAIFFICLVQCENRIKRLRNEDSVLRNIRKQRRARVHWDKLRKYVKYTYGCEQLEDDIDYNSKHQSRGTMMMGSISGLGSLHRKKLQSRKDSISFDKKCDINVEMNVVPVAAQTERVRSESPEGSMNLRKDMPHTKGEHVLGQSIEKEGLGVHSSNSDNRYNSQPQVALPTNDSHSVPPVPELNINGKTNVSDIQKSLQNLYDYNVCLRDRFIEVQSLLNEVLKKASQEGDMCST